MLSTYEKFSTKPGANDNQQKSSAIYHGSPILFTVPKCQPSTRFDKKGNMIWSGEAVFAAYDRRIALQYTANKVTDYTNGVDLTTKISENAPISLFVLGGKNIEDALNALYGTEDESTTKGYLYKMSSKYFRYEKGLGIMERISQTPEASDFLIEIEVINRRKEINQYLKNGLIEIHWKPGLHNYLFDAWKSKYEKENPEKSVRGYGPGAIIVSYKI